MSSGDMFMTKTVAPDCINEYGHKSSLRKGIQSEDVSKRYVHPLQTRDGKILNKPNFYKMIRDNQVNCC